MPEISPHAVTEEQYTDEHGNMVVKKVNNLFFTSVNPFRIFNIFTSIPLAEIASNQQ